MQGLAFYPFFAMSLINSIKHDPLYYKYKEQEFAFISYK